MDAKPNSVHPLAKDFRARRDLMLDEASVLEGIEPVRAYLAEHGDEFAYPDGVPKRFSWGHPFAKRLALLIRNTARLGFYDDALAGSSRYEVLTGKRLDYFIDEGRYLRGDYRLSFHEVDADAKWGSLDQVKKGKWIAHVALMNGDLDDSDALLQKVASFRAGQRVDSQLKLQERAPVREKIRRAGWCDLG